MNTPLADPIVCSAATCSGKSGCLCGAVMNPIHIYKAKDARPEMRGAICQSVRSSSYESFDLSKTHSLSTQDIVKIFIH